MVYLCVFFSGAAGLIYEVIWSRQLNQFLGITTYAHTAVLTAYMVGLAAGSLLIGRAADRIPAPMKLYGWLEIGIGLFAALTPWLFTLIQHLYTALAPLLGLGGASGNLLRFTLALVSLLVPTFMMGGTLPLLVRGLTISLKGLAKSTGRLYGLNTLGAAMGSAAAGYFLIPMFGMRGSIFITVLISAGVGGTILFLGERLPSPIREIAEEESEQSRLAPSEAALSHWAAWVFLIGFAISGIAALVYELAWIRALTLVIGSSVYAFSTTLATYLVGIAAGSLVYARFAGRGDTLSRLRLTALMELGISLTAILSLFLIGRLPDLFLSTYPHLQSNYSLFQLLYFSLSFLVMFSPTFLMGVLFPLATAVWARESAQVGRDVGIAYAARSVGNIFGALLGGLVLLPTLGVQGSLFLAAGTSASLSALFWFLRPAKDRTMLRLAGIPIAIGLFILALLLVPDWDNAVMNAGVYSRPERFLDQRGYRLEDIVADTKILFYQEGIDGIVSVVESTDQRRLVINGKTDATTGGDLPTQVMLGQLPLLIYPDANDVLVIGLGSGVTAGSVATHESVANLDVLEISPEVVKASEFFHSVNKNVLDDPRTNLIVADARNYLMGTTKRYDVIISEPSNPWISGISNLFTRDFFELAKSRLAPGGVMSQWFHTYDMSEEDLRSVLETYQTVFPYVTVWKPIIGDLILIGSAEPHAVDIRNLQTALQQGSVAEDLRGISLESEQQLVDLFLVDEEIYADFTAGAQLNTDDKPHLEFNAPRALYAGAGNEDLFSLITYLEGNKFAAPVTGLVNQEDGRLLAPFISLAITTQDNAPVAALQASWLVERGLKEVNEGISAFTTGNQGFLSWESNGIKNQLIATRFNLLSDIPDQLQTLESIMVNGISKAGDGTMPGNIDSIWTAGPGDQEGRIAVSISWVCEADNGDFFNFVFLQLMPEPGQEELKSVIENSAANFQCLEN